MIASVGLIGDPVGHSLSPAFQSAAFAHYGLPDSYVLWPTPLANLPNRMALLRATGMRGANVTIPHKTAVLPLLDTIDPIAEAVGAVNTIVRSLDGQLHGLNTDVEGFLRSLQAVGSDPAGQSVVLLGAGGAARAVGYGLIHAGVRALIVVNRTVERAEALLADLSAATDADPNLRALSSDDPAVGEAMADAELLVNATSLGLDGRSLPMTPDLLRPGLLVVDLIYHHTPLLQIAAARGAMVQDGLEMLVQQGALAFEAWTKFVAPLDVMRTVAQQALKERS